MSKFFVVIMQCVIGHGWETMGRVEAEDGLDLKAVRENVAKLAEQIANSDSFYLTMEDGSSFIISPTAGPITFHIEEEE